MGNTGCRATEPCQISDQKLPLSTQRRGIDSATPIQAKGWYHYRPQDHHLERLGEGDLRQAIWAAGLQQDPLRQAPAVLVLSAVVERSEAKYGSRAQRYVQMEAGHAAQNLLLQAVALGLGAVPIGAFEDAQVQDILGLSKAEIPLYLIPVGEPAQD